MGKLSAHFILLNDLQMPIPTKIHTIQEAEFLLQSTYDLWAACQTNSSIARSQLEEALVEFVCADHQLQQAELDAGQAWYAIHQGGFEHLILSSSWFPETYTPGEHWATTTCANSDACWIENPEDLSQAMALIRLD